MCSVCLTEAAGVESLTELVKARVSGELLCLIRRGGAPPMTPKYLAQWGRSEN